MRYDLNMCEILVMRIEIPITALSFKIHAMLAVRRAEMEQSAECRLGLALSSYRSEIAACLRLTDSVSRALPSHADRRAVGACRAWPVPRRFASRHCTRLRWTLDDRCTAPACGLIGSTCAPKKAYQSK